MTRYAKLNPLPLGAITASGWLKEQLTRNKHGMGGHLDELEPRMIATPYTTRESEPRWGKDRQAGWGAEISGNYWNGLIELAFTLDDEELKAKATRWVDEVLKNQRADGYLGTYTEDDDPFDDYNAWGSACGMNAMMSYYSATGRADVLDAVYKCMLWFCDNWAGDRKTRYGGVAIVSTMSDCYQYVRDERLRAFCEDYYRFLEKDDLFSKSLSAFLAPQLHYNCNHGAGYAESLSHPLEVYLMNGDEKYLNATLNAYRKARDKVIQKTGGITCEAEYLAPLGAIVETEYCGIAMYNWSLGRMAYTTGDTEYGDQMERAVFNAGEGARKKDEKAIAYLSSPNQVFATTSSSVADHHHQVYAPCVPVACCPVMSVRLLPEFLRHAVMTDDNQDIWFYLYAPYTAKAGNLTVSADTLYPFRDTIRFTLSAAAPEAHTLHFRIPAWCKCAKLQVNGIDVDARSENGYLVLDGTWQDGDVVTLILPMEVRVDRVDDSDRSSKFPIVLEHGPLLFALPIPESWNGFPGDPVTPLPDGWQWFNVEPIIPPPVNADVYDDMGQRKHRISWNVALDEDLTADKVTVEMLEPCGYPWENPPIRLQVPGWKAPFSYPPYPAKTSEPYGDKGRVAVTHPLNLTLIPFGCTALRISYFPRSQH